MTDVPTAPSSGPYGQYPPPVPPPAPEQRPCYAPPTGRWGLGDVGWFVLILVGTIIASAVLIIPFIIIAPDAFTATGIDASTPLGSWILTLAQTFFFAGMVAWPLVVGWWKADGWRKAFGFVVSWRAVWIGAVGGIATLIAMTVLTGITAVVFDQEVNSAGAEAAESMTGSTLAFVLFLLLIAFGAPFVEEIAFRGLVWGAVVKRGWSPWLATVIAGVPFALMHIEPIRVAPLLAAGLVLGTVRQFGGLGAAMLAHAVVNGIGAIAIAAS
jgi:membrane protease YdiL (CAAX protease family)